FVLRAGRPPARFGEVVLDSALARQTDARLGDRVDLVVRGAPGSYRVVGVAQPALPISGTLVFFSDGESQVLSGPDGEVDSIGVLAKPRSDVGAPEDRIDAAARGSAVVTLTGDDRGLAEFPEARSDGETLIAISGVFGGLAILVAMLVVAGTLALSILMRERELALLRAIGASPRQVRRMIVAETMFVSVFAAALGCVLGIALGRRPVTLILARA